MSLLTQLLCDFDVFCWLRFWFKFLFPNVFCSQHFTEYSPSPTYGWGSVTTVLVGLHFLSNEGIQGYSCLQINDYCSFLKSRQFLWRCGKYFSFLRTGLQSDRTVLCHNEKYSVGIFSLILKPFFSSRSYLTGWWELGTTNPYTAFPLPFPDDLWQWKEACHWRT